MYRRQKCYLPSMLDPDRLLGATLERWLTHPEAPGSIEAADIYRHFHRYGSHRAVAAGERTIEDIAEEDGTRKFLLRHADGCETESVIMPIEGRSGRVRQTLCLSSQIGCAMGCTFCQTANMGRVRNLTTAEIVAQWHHAEHDLHAEITNIVFMGMGEPMDNLDSVLAAIEILTDHNAAAVPPSRIGVSTVGHVEGIRRFTEFMQRDGMHQVRLAVSVNAPNDAIRGELMPITRAVSMKALHEAMSEWIAAGGRPVLIEYVLIPGVNDDPAGAEELAQWLDALPCRLNVIPYNPKVDSPWPAPDEDCVEQFIEAAATAGLTVNRRQTRGRQVMAACGQLGGV
ncbi:MAG TPA: 23S rRNA (adenine(2503)-C2)-methyltransferase [Phycisphaerales bacterium]|nr:23S rRNA (adenine(2503)-C2)-methyltransferase [Phycisphaerales bacterium]